MLGNIKAFLKGVGQEGSTGRKGQEKESDLKKELSNLILGKSVHMVCERD